MTVLRRLVQLFDRHLAESGHSPTRLVLGDGDRAGLALLRPADWPFRHLADRAGDDPGGAVAEFLGVADVRCGGQTRFE